MVALQNPTADIHIQLRYGATGVIFDDSMIILTFSSLVLDFWDSGAWFMSFVTVMCNCIHPVVTAIFFLVYLLRERYFVVRHHSSDVYFSSRKAGQVVTYDMLTLGFDALFFALEISARFALVDLVFQSFLQAVIKNDIKIAEFPFHRENKDVFVYLGVSMSANPNTGIYIGLAVSVGLILLFRIISYIVKYGRGSRLNDREKLAQGKKTEEGLSNQESAVTVLTNSKSTVYVDFLRRLLVPIPKNPRADVKPLRYETLCKQVCFSIFSGSMLLMSLLSLYTLFMVWIFICMC